MMKKNRIADRLLEQWSSWRITEEIYTGTGNSSIVRFSEPCGTRHSGCYPLYFGISNRFLAMLDADLSTQFSIRKMNLLMMIYGLPGDDFMKIKQLKVSQTIFDTLKQSARLIALQHIEKRQSVTT